MSITINSRKNALEITKDFSKKASIFGSDEYKELKEAKTDFPTYRVIIKSASKRKIEDRITMKDILRYVESHSGADSEEMKTLMELRGSSAKKTGNIFEADETANFADIKKWFFLTYPEISNKTEKRQNRIDEILAQAAAKANEAASA